MSRDLNRWVAESVMGFNVETGVMHYDGSDIHYEIWIDKDGNKHNPKDYSTNINVAWEIVDKIKQEDQYYFKLENGDLKDYECHFSSYSAEADTAPMAICLAALKIIGVETGL